MNSTSVDGFSAGTPTAVLRDGRDALLAVAMNGEPLPLEHGFPVRMVVPGLYGYVSATKWLSKLELTTFADYDAYWVPRGWAAKAPIKTGSRLGLGNRSPPASTSSPESPGHSTAESPQWRYGWTKVRGRPPPWARWRRRTRGACGPGRGRRRQVTMCWRCARRTTQARFRLTRSHRRRPTEPPAIT